jgi:cytochrome c-type biogenesis protein CcsB
MNHVLNHRGYRFFQSSYDQDERGTILSVNHDAIGTAVTYIGYFLMTLGMFLSVFNRYTRFSFLGKVVKEGVEKFKGAAITLFLTMLFLIPALSAQNHPFLSVDDIQVVNKKEAKAFGELLVQSHDGRIMPINTLSSEILRKLTKKTKYKGLTPDQVLLGMVSDPLSWQQVPLIKIRFGVARNKELQKILGVDGDYASYFDFIDMKTGNYKLGIYVADAYNKKPAHRSLFDKDIIKADEKMNICYMIYTGEMLRMLPNPTDPYKPWYSTVSSIRDLPPNDSAMIVQILPAYFNSVKNGNYRDAADLREGIKIFQEKFGKEIIPPTRKIKAEILYNRLMIFDNLSKLYGVLGFVMFILIFINLFKRSSRLLKVINIFIIITALGFLYQTFGLGLRWYISGHAPWSDGYESMIYIGWITLLAGLLFSLRSPMTVAATTILTSVILMVAHLTWMEPEITNLVPVLKSYWLTIHVSVITASYGFLALSMLLGFINLVLMILKNKSNKIYFNNRILELSAINERSMTIGLYMLTVGTFLGGVWANESWGRYWGWDPKETWALVSVLVYTFILHMRFIPALKGKFVFNLASVLGYFSIIMTYFGVNFYLSGLHSYAKGDPVPVPDFIFYTIAVIGIVSVWAYAKEKKIEKV